MADQPESLNSLEAGRASRHYWRDLWRYRELLGLAWRHQGAPIWRSASCGR
jgi:hypothetical protein